jgi:large subunit ribosomal protein L18
MNIRATRFVRARIKSSGRYSVRIFLSNQHTYAQIVNPQGIVMTSLTTQLITETKSSGSNLAAAAILGSALGKKIVAMELQDKIAFDRSGKKYHGRVKAIAESARVEGVKF